MKRLLLLLLFSSGSLFAMHPSQHLYNTEVFDFITRHCEQKLSQQMIKTKQAITTKRKELDQWYLNGKKDHDAIRALHYGIRADTFQLRKLVRHALQTDQKLSHQVANLKRELYKKHRNAHIVLSNQSIFLSVLNRTADSKLKHQLVTNRKFIQQTKAQLSSLKQQQPYKKGNPIHISQLRDQMKDRLNRQSELINQILARDTQLMQQVKQSSYSSKFKKTRLYN